MYAYIKGTLEETGEDYIVVEAGGIGYQIFTTGQTFQYLPSMGEEVKVYTYLHVREDAMILFGFLTKDDLFVFRLLLGVSGIGPKGALAILSVMTTDDLRFAVLGDDGDDIIHLLIIGTDDEGGVAGHEETAGGGQLGHGKTLFGQRGKHLGAIIFIDYGKYEFHTKIPSLGQFLGSILFYTFWLYSARG